jgi:uncharacterized protein (TIGR03083 family)
MQLSPRYHGPAVISFDPPPADPSVPLLRQRRRLADTLATLDDDRWAAPSRCAGWSCGDVVRHLVSVNSFWTASVAAGRRGHPTRFLVGFDPVATPAQLVDGEPRVGTQELLEAYVSTTDALAAVLADLDAEEWARPAEAPPGHVAISSVALHALWDGWIHERDIALPLGLDVDEEPDEVAGGLRYVVGVGPALLATTGSPRTGAFGVHATDPDLDLVVEVGPEVVVHERRAGDGLVTVRGHAVELLESFSLRADPPILPEPDRWMVGGLAVAFDQGV